MTTITNNKLTDETLKAWKIEAMISLGETPKDCREYSHHEAIFALVTELQERRKTEAEPIGYMNRFTGRVFSLDEQPGADTDTAVYLPVYTAPPAPVVPDELLSAMEEVLRISDRDHEAWHKARNGITSCRAAMLQSFGNSEQLEPVTEAYKLRERVRREHAEWSDKTFGDVGPVGPLKHLSKEALETAANPEDPLEWADMQFLLWDAQRRMGISDRFITRAMIEKLAINKTRQWPEPKDGEPRLHIKKSGNSPVIPDGYVMVPKRLTAENGAKGVLSGEFSETKFINCPECFGDDECETCDGSGRIEITVPVTWTTIKAVWAKGVELFAAAPQQDKSHG